MIDPQAHANVRAESTPNISLCLKDAPLIDPRVGTVRLIIVQIVDHFASASTRM